MKPTPTHPVPDLHRALETPPLCTKCGNESVERVQRKVRYFVHFPERSVANQVACWQCTSWRETSNVSSSFKRSISRICIFSGIFTYVDFFFLSFPFSSNCAIFDYSVASCGHLASDLLPDFISAPDCILFIAQCSKGCVICSKEQN